MAEARGLSRTNYRKENERLKRLVADKEPIISVKDELLKKTSLRASNGGRSSL
jgi:hypothetical protein